MQTIGKAAAHTKDIFLKQINCNFEPVSLQKEEGRTKELIKLEYIINAIQETKVELFDHFEAHIDECPITEFKIAKAVSAQGAELDSSKFAEINKEDGSVRIFNFKEPIDCKIYVQATAGKPEPSWSDDSVAQIHLVI